jgi:predicted HAD superfamily Cof-like phosphohydrolase
MTVFNWLEAFIEKFNFKLKADDPNIYEKLNFAVNGLIGEEYMELKKALEEGDPEEIVDALGDISWLCIKLMMQLGVNPQFVFDEIGNANLTKERGIKPGREQSGGFDVIKPKGWEPPNHEGNHGILDDVF